MRIEIWLTGKTKGTWQNAAMDEYLKRCSRYGSVECVVITESKHAKSDAIRKDESERILAQLQKGQRAFTVLLDETGKQLSSPGLAKMLSRQFTLGFPAVRFIVGGAYGVDASVKGTVNFVLSLSDLTFPHQLVRILFLEQLYRAFTILRGENYHHE